MLFSHMQPMVLEYESLHLPQKSPSHVGKYTSTMEHLGLGTPGSHPHFIMLQGLQRAENLDHFVATLLPLIKHVESHKWE